MKLAARPLLVLHSDEDLRDRIRAVAGRDYSFQAVDGWTTLMKAVREAPPSAVVIVDPLQEPGPLGISPQLHALSVSFPSIPILAALKIRVDAADLVRRLGKTGIVDIISIGHDDTPNALRQRLAGAEGRPLRLLMEQILPTDISGRARAIVDAATRTVSVGGCGHDLAASLQLSRRTLLRWCEAARLLPPRRLLAWMRILLASEMLDDGGRTVSDVARACGYSADSGLRRVTMVFVGATPTDLRRRGAFAGAAKHFLRELEGYRNGSGEVESTN